jgi:hypothetical protein
MLRKGRGKPALLVDNQPLAYAQPAQQKDCHVNNMFKLKGCKGLRLNRLRRAQHTSSASPFHILPTVPDLSEHESKRLNLQEEEEEEEYFSADEEGRPADQKRKSFSKKYQKEEEDVESGFVDDYSQSQSSGSSIGGFRLSGSSTRQSTSTSSQQSLDMGIGMRASSVISEASTASENTAAANPTNMTFRGEQLDPERASIGSASSLEITVN